MCIIRLEALSDFTLTLLLVLVSYRQLKRGFEHTRRVLLIEYFNDKIAGLPLLARRLMTRGYFIITCPTEVLRTRRPSQANPSVRRHT